MKSSKFWGRAVVVAALLLLAVGGTAFAQLQSGNLYGSVVDDKGAALPGVTVTLTGAGAPQVQVTNAQGQFRFLGLPPGNLHLSAQLEGFSSVEYPNINIAVGRNTTIEVTLQPAIEETITVTTESPLLDERKISTGSTVTQTELEKIPTSRDPWTILSQVPGVLTDRINVGGDQSGQQSTYVGPGSAGTQSIWAVDGVVITDMGALGASPTYYDFDAFEEMQVTTGGTDATIATGGVVLNMVTKRGTNEWRGSGRYYDTKSAWQDSTSFDKGKLGKPGPWQGGSANQLAQPSFARGNRIVEVTDYGAELGGPIVKDRLWIWGAWGTQRPHLLTAPALPQFPDGVSDKTVLETTNAKLNAQVTANNSATGFYLLGNKTKQGRGAGPTRPQPTTWNQTGPTHVYKAEDTQIFSSSFFLTGLVSYARNGFSLTPQGGLNTNTSFDANFVWQNSFFLYSTDRPTHQYKLDGSNFFNTGSVSHELKYGAGYRKATISSITHWAGIGWQQDYYASYGLPNELAAARDARPVYTIKYKSGYAQDTLTVGNLTANIGLRYDIQGGTNDPKVVPANPAVPTFLPEINYKGGDIGFEYKTLAPRMGLTYALGAERKTLLRLSYSRFADQLGGGTANWLNPLYPPSYVYFDYVDKNGNGQADPSELIFPCSGRSSCYNQAYNPDHPDQPISSNALNPNLKPQITDEILLSAEHALLPEFVVGLNFTFRRISDVQILDDLVFNGDPFSASNLLTTGRVATPSDYVANHVSGTLPNGQTYTQTYFDLKPGLASRGGKYLHNSDVREDYKGATFTFNKRLSNRWMLRGNFNVQKWTWDVPNGTLADPTNLLPGLRDGEPVLQGSATGNGSRGAVYINSNWSYNVNGLYQVAPDRPWGFNFALNATGRQGYPIPYFRRVQRNGFNGTSNIIVTNHYDSFRNEDIHLLDGRIEKELNFKDFGVTVGVDCFNMLNNGNVIQ
ncbi:MAG TPA: carboxypeptidase regulatory-like domain-containing protein, partial [Thermoanaerobaculia bacterium]|nr:carboxypeptidase regulatory-like domain-containing protein [Thermoanaerobaculia bacterium]